MRRQVFPGAWPAGIALVAALAVPAAADRAEDDLQVVRKAVASAPAASPRPPAEAPAPPSVRPVPREGAPRWLRVRVVEKAGQRARVSVDLPLGIVLALGHEWPVGGEERCRRGGRCATLGEVLRALDAGQSLVEIEDDEATVRVWVD